MRINTGTSRMPVGDIVKGEGILMKAGLDTSKVVIMSPTCART